MDDDARQSAQSGSQEVNAGHRGIGPDGREDECWGRGYRTKYAYVRNNPIAYVDPSGHAFEFVGNAWSAASNAVSRVAGAVDDALNRAGHWFGYTRVGKYLGRAVRYAEMQIDAMSKDPLVIASFLVAVAASVATGQLAFVTAWANATALSVAATSLALAAGVTNRSVLSLIGAAAAAAGGGFTLRSALLAGGAWGVSEGATRLGYGDQVHVALSVVNMLATMLKAVNTLTTVTAEEPGLPDELPASDELFVKAQYSPQSTLTGAKLAAGPDTGTIVDRLGATVVRLLGLVGSIKLLLGIGATILTAVGKLTAGAWLAGVGLSFGLVAVGVAMVVVVAYGAYGLYRVWRPSDSRSSVSIRRRRRRARPTVFRAGTLAWA